VYILVIIHRQSSSS